MSEALKAWKVGDDPIGYLVFAAPNRLRARKMMASCIGEHDENWDWMYLRALRCPKADHLAVKEGEIDLPRDLWVEVFGRGL